MFLSEHTYSHASPASSLMPENARLVISCNVLHDASRLALDKLSIATSSLPRTTNPPQDLQDLVQSVRVVTNESLDQAIYYRLGFVWLDQLAGANPGPVSEQEWTRIQKLLGDHGSRIDETLKPSIVAFVQSFVSQPPVPPQIMWDLHPSCPRRITLDDIHLGVSRVKWEGSKIDSYLIGDSQVDAIPWRLTVDDPLHIVECIRRGLGPGPLEIIRYFLTKGIAFNTWAIVPNGRLFSRTRSHDALGFRPITFAPSVADYIAYEDRRNTFLSGPHARMALMKGGILWRLAKDTVSSDCVLSGPSRNALSFGVFKTATTGFPNETFVYDDSLSREEMDLICGVYNVANGESASLCMQIATYVMYRETSA
jgi:hypothetical protein